MEPANVLVQISAAGIASADRKMLMRHAVELAMKSRDQIVRSEEAETPSLIGVASDFQILAEGVIGKPLGSPGRAFAAVRARLPPDIRTRVQRVVRARNNAAHPARADPELLGEVERHLGKAGSESSSTAAESYAEDGPTAAYKETQSTHTYIHTYI